MRRIRLMFETPTVVVIVDDHELFSQGLALLLSHQWSDYFTVAGQTTFVEEAADLVIKTAADIAIVDLSMPPLGGVAAIRHIRRVRPQTRILALSGTNDFDLAIDALHAGADGFLPKTANPNALVGPLRTVVEGFRVVDGAVLDSLLTSTRNLPAGLAAKLTAQDIKLWALIATGMETVDIAKRMLVSDRTAKRMIAALLNKVGAANRISAAALAGKYGLLDDQA